MEIAPFTGYVYPNEGVIQWSVLIVIYPYLTGFVAGAFTVSSFYHVFGMQRFKPVARLALLTSLCVMVFVPVPPVEAGPMQPVGAEPLRNMPFIRGRGSWIIRMN